VDAHYCAAACTAVAACTVSTVQLHVLHVAACTVELHVLAVHAEVGCYPQRYGNFGQHGGQTQS
jgi:hypothetical protein